MNNLKPGMKVKIYQRPVARADFEGEATLISEYRPDNGDGLSLWIVNFDGDYPDETYVRAIFVDDDEKAQIKSQDSIQAATGIQVENFTEFYDGWSVTTQTELDAYKLAYKYRHCKKITVTFAPNVNQWLVSVYWKED